MYEISRQILRKSLIGSRKLWRRTQLVNFGLHF